MVHQIVGCFNGRIFNPLNAVFRSAGFHSSLQNNLCSGNRALLCAGMEAEDNGVTGFNGAERLKDCGRSRIGYRGYAADNADGFSNFQIAFQFVVVDNANRLHIFDAVPDIFGGEHILDDLVLIDTALGFFHRHLGKLHVVVQTGQNHLVTNVVDLFLGVAHELIQSFLGFRYMLVDDLLDVNLLFGLNGSFFFRHITVPPSVLPPSRCPESDGIVKILTI